LIIDDVRKKKEDLIGDDALNTITDNTENKLDLISNEQLMEVISSLTDDYRDVIVMYYINDMTIREIADVFNKTEGAIRTMLSRAIKALKKELKIV
ncbi:MAG TPA: sigma-70 family RNA polymerase sigma factor, partial [bacterium]|nr:sigma-70 family RNA polymerase sigma factor [bacterium]